MRGVRRPLRTSSWLDCVVEGRVPGLVLACLLHARPSVLFIGEPYRIPGVEFPLLCHVHAPGSSLGHSKAVVSSTSCVLACAGEDASSDWEKCSGCIGVTEFCTETNSGRRSMISSAPTRTERSVALARARRRNSTRLAASFRERTKESATAGDGLHPARPSNGTDRQAPIFCQLRETGCLGIHDCVRDQEMFANERSIY